jgi:hypothetical protein
MDTMGDAEQYEYDDELPTPREPLLSDEALAVMSLTAALSSVFVVGLSQYVAFLFSGVFAFNNGDDQVKQAALLMAPTSVLSFIAVAAGVTAVKRRPDNPWAGALAVAGAVVGGLILVLAVAAVLAVWIRDPSFATE